MAYLSYFGFVSLVIKNYMYGMCSYVENIQLLQNNFTLLIISISGCGLLAYVYEHTPFRLFFKHENIWSYLITMLTHIMVISFMIFMINGFYFFSQLSQLSKMMVNRDNLYVLNLVSTDVVLSGFLPTISLNFSLDFFGFVLLFLSYVVGFISLLALDTRLYWKNWRFVFTFNLFVIIVYLYVTTTNLLLFFLFYEFLLLPSFLFVYFVSASRRAIQASIYFVIWTQLGSFLVLAACSYIVVTVGSSDFDIIKRFVFTDLETFTLYTLLFLGFGFKVPIWPFHYWLTKTHVEAPSGFSIYLSGFLVKSALYGFYKITTLLSGEVNTSFFILITLLGVFDSSLKMWGQSDIKKLVAYGTIQEMNLIYLVFCWGDASIITAGIVFTATHAFLSALMFYLVDCVYRRFHTRSLVEINGILHITPNLGISVLVMTVFFAGLPGTIKFISEFFIFSSFFEVSPIMCVLLMLVANVVGLVGFSKVWFNLVFGGFTKYTKYLPMDLSFREIYMITINFIFLFFLSYTPLMLF